MDDNRSAREAKFEEMISRELKAAQQSVHDIDRFLEILQTEQNQAVRVKCWEEIGSIQLKLDQETNPTIQGWRNELTRLNRITIDEFEGKCTVCHQFGHKQEQCSVEEAAN